MRKKLLVSAAALVLSTGVAAAQNDAGTAAAPATPPAANPAPPAANPAPPAAAPATPPAATAAPAPPAATASPTAGDNVRADDLIGRSVQGSDGKPLGKVKDAVVDAKTGKIEKLVIASGGFLGIGAKNVAVDFDKVEIRPEGGVVAKNLTQNDIQNMPKYDVASETKPLDQPPPTPPAGAASPGTTGAGVGPTGTGVGGTGMGVSPGGVGTGGTSVTPPQAGGAAGTAGSGTSQ